MYALRNLKLVSIISPNKEKFFKENDKNLLKNIILTYSIN